MLQKSEGASLAGCVHVGSQHPLLRGLLLVDEPQGDLVELHLKPRAYFGEVDLLVALLLEGVVPQRYQVALVAEGYHSLAVDLRHREEVLEDVHEPLPELAGEVVEDQVGVRLGNGFHFLLNVVPQHNVLQSEVDGGPQRHVAHYQPIRLAPVFVQHHHIGQSLGQAEVDEVVYDVAAPVDSLGVREQDCHFLLELQQTGRGASAGGDQNLRVGVERVAVLVVDVGSRDDVVRVVRLQLLAQLVGLLEQLGRQLLMLFVGLLHLQLALHPLLLCLLPLEREQELAALPDVLSQHINCC